jgi:hypothetical protein
MVYLMTEMEAINLSMAGIEEDIYLGTAFSTAMEGTAAVDLITSRVMHGRGTIDSFFAYVTNFDTGLVGGDQDLNLEIAAVNTTGGVLNCLYTQADTAAELGVKIAATAITAANEYSDGDLVSVEMAGSGTGMTADKFGAWELWMTVTKLPGA